MREIHFPDILFAGYSSIYCGKIVLLLFSHMAIGFSHNSALNVLAAGLLQTLSDSLERMLFFSIIDAVSYTHLTLPTILRV